VCFGDVFGLVDGVDGGGGVWLGGEGVGVGCCLCVVLVVVDFFGFSGCECVD